MGSPIESTSATQNVHTALLRLSSASALKQTSRPKVLNRTRSNQSGKASDYEMRNRYRSAPPKMPSIIRIESTPEKRENNLDRR